MLKLPSQNRHTVPSSDCEQPGKVRKPSTTRQTQSSTQTDTLEPMEEYALSRLKNSPLQLEPKERDPETPNADSQS
jgi:hypothetical protein